MTARTRRPRSALRQPDDGLWPSYNKTLTSDRFSSLPRSTAKRGRLKVLCTYDTDEYTGFNSGLLRCMAAGVRHRIRHLLHRPNHLPSDWHGMRAIRPRRRKASIAALPIWMGACFAARRMAAFWPTTSTPASGFGNHHRRPQKSESAPAAPIAWNGLVFIGNAGGDIKGVKGRMYALDATTGKIVWEFYLVPKQPGRSGRGPQAISPLDGSTWKTPPARRSRAVRPGRRTRSIQRRVCSTCPAAILHRILRGACARVQSLFRFGGRARCQDRRLSEHFKIVPRDWHDWDVSSAPELISTAEGKHMMFVAPKDGHLYGFDLATHKLLYRTPVTKVENADAPFSPARRAFLSRLGRRRRMERTGLRPHEQSRVQAKSIGARPFASSRSEGPKAKPGTPGPPRIRSIPTIPGASRIPSANGRAGSTPSMPTPATGAGARKPTIPFKAV